jgi:hypothetical protein
MEPSSTWLTGWTGRPPQWPIGMSHPHGSRLFSHGCLYFLLIQILSEIKISEISGRGFKNLRKVMLLVSRLKGKVITWHHPKGGTQKNERDTTCRRAHPRSGMVPNSSTPWSNFHPPTLFLPIPCKLSFAFRVIRILHGDLFTLG